MCSIRLLQIFLFYLPFLSPSFFLLLASKLVTVLYTFPLIFLDTKLDCICVLNIPYYWFPFAILFSICASFLIVTPRVFKLLYSFECVLLLLCLYNLLCFRTMFVFSLWIFNRYLLASLIIIFHNYFLFLAISLNHRQNTFMFDLLASLRIMLLQNCSGKSV